MYPILFLLAFFLAALRIGGEKSETFQAIAHLFVGGLLAASWMEWKTNPVAAKTNLGLALLLSVVEVLCFVWFRFHS